MFRKFNSNNSILFQAGGILTYFNRFNDFIYQKLVNLSNLLFRKWEIAYVIMGLLLGRAMILEELSPFAIPFFAVVYHLKKEKLIFIAIALLVGSNMSVYSNSPIMFSQMVLFIFIQKRLDNKNKSDLSYTPLIVAFSIVLPNFALHFYQNVDQFYPWFISSIEGILGAVLTLIFVQAMPIIIYRRDQVSLSQEEIIALTIVLASVMTGTLGWSLNGFSIEHIFSRYFILIFALVGGSAIGASVGVVTGLILSLSNLNAIYQISLLAFSGLLAGLLKQGNKIGVAIGLLLGTTILSIYLGNQQEIWNSFSESSIAIIMFLLTPKNLIEKVAKFIPGTNEYHHHYQDYVSKIRNVTSSKIDQFSSMFSQLAMSFKEISTSPSLDQSEQIDHFINQISEKHCKTCWKRQKCWDDEFFQTYRLITDLMSEIETKGKINKKDIPKEWGNHCVKSDQIAYQLIDIYEAYGEHLYWKNQLEESRLLVAHQLFGVSKVMKDLSLEIQKEAKELGIQEEQIHQSLEQLGLAIRQVNVISLDEGNVSIEVMQPSCNGTDECNKIIAPLISEVVGENLIVKNKDCDYAKEGTCKMYLRSAKTFEVETGFASAAKDGKWLSGDSFSTIEIGNGKFAVVLSDGMGNGERAHRESKATLELLQQLLQSGIDETLSLKTINSVLLLRSQEEIFTTVDLAIIDLFSGQTEFLKVGSTPSFIKRGDDIIALSANNLPIGMIQDIDIDSINYALMPGDLLIMITDGIYDSPKQTVNKELWIKRIIQDIETDNPQEFADLILEKVIRQEQGSISDDMTVVVTRIDEYKPEWSTIKIPGISRIEREKMIN